MPVSVDAFRTFALSLPEAVEAPHRDRRSFRVRNRIFATLRPDEERAVLKLSRLAQEALVATDPETFRLTPWGRQGWTSVELGRVDADELRELTTEAWRGVAPKRVVAAAGL